MIKKIRILLNICVLKDKKKQIYRFYSQISNKIEKKN